MPEYDAGHNGLIPLMVKCDQQIRLRRTDMIKEKKKTTKDSIIGDVIKQSPEAKAVIQKYFGNGCFTCPGINMESISFGSMMHNLDPNKIVDEINALEE
jgi:hybrid cluster-associated redox disulfide protein